MQGDNAMGHFSTSVSVMRAVMREFFSSRGTNEFLFHDSDESIECETLITLEERTRGFSFRKLMIHQK